MANSLVDPDPSPPTVYISYSRKDRAWRDRIVRHLSPLEQAGILRVWDDQSIESGKDWEEEIRRALNSARVVLFLVSANSLSSTSVTSEVQNFLEMRKREDSRLIPVLLSPCDWQEAPWLARIQMYPRDARPLQTMMEGEVDAVLASLATEITHLIGPSASDTERDNIHASRRTIAANELGEVFGASELSIPWQDLRWQDKLVTIKRDLLRKPGDEPRIVGICGPGGTGKTTLAIKVAYDEEVRRTFSDGVFYLRLHTQYAPTEQVRDALSSSAPQVTRASNYQLLKILGERKILLIFDEPEFDHERTSQFIDDLAYETRVLIVTRKQQILAQLRASIHFIGDPFIDKLGDTDAPGDLPSDSGDKLRSGEMTLGELLSETDLGKAMDEADQAAFRVGAALARTQERPEFNSMDVFAGYLLSGKPGTHQSEQALVKAAWDNYTINYLPGVKSEELEMWRVISQQRLDQVIELSFTSWELIANWKLSSGLGRMLLRSVEVATEAERPQPFSTRHLLACLLGPREWPLDPSGAAAIARFALDFPALRRDFAKWIKRSRKDKAVVINAVLGIADEQTEHSVEATTPFQKTYSFFTPDRAAFGRRVVDTPLDDALGVGVHAGHLAQLIAAKETWMPLSIGLFGAWGAGKSHFIDLLDEHLRALTREPGKIFHQRIVQIRFNAWHYLDTNLWANLVSEIFDGLFAALEDRKDTTTEQVQKLKGELAKQSALAAEAKEALKTAEIARVDAEAQLRTAMQERMKEEGKVGALLDDLKSLVTNDQLRDQLRVVAEGLGIPKLEKSFAELEARAAELRTLGGRTKALTLAIFTGPGLWKRGLLLAVALAVPLAVAWLATNGAMSIQTLLQGAGRTIAQVVAATAALAAWLSSQVKAGNSLVSKVETAYDDVKKARAAREATDEATTALNALAAKRQTEEEARHTLHEAEEKMKTIRADLAELAPGRQLIRFLKDRASAEDYRRHLGLVSLVRKDFEQLSHLLTKATEKEDVSLPRIDRIVLYIDDLDRCRADRVIEVLEAVHLLLAFPLFAVVVAVDPRWLRQSLLDQYPRLLGHADGDEANIRAATLGRAATPQDYLEKIFQVPFNLQAMEKPGFDALVGQLFPITKTSAGNIQPALTTTRPSPPPGPQPMAAPGSETVTVQPIMPDPSTPPQPVSSSGVLGEQVKQPPPDPQRLTLTRKEVTDVRQFQPLFQTPRAVKRLANTYCLIRVGVNEGDWGNYLGIDETPGTYRIPMLLLAVTSAFPALARPWLLWLQDTAPTRWQLADNDITALIAKYRDTTDSDDWRRLAHCLNQLTLQTGRHRRRSRWRNGCREWRDIPSDLFGLPEHCIGIRFLICVPISPRPAPDSPFPSKAS